MSSIFLAKQFLQHWLGKVNEHSLHSPFLYHLYTEVIKKDDPTGFEEIEALANSLAGNHDSIDVLELGAGSRVDNHLKRKISDILRFASTPTRFSRLLFRLIRSQNYTNIVELGTSLGINTLYMHQANPEATLTTFEGSPSIADLAKNHFQSLGAKNVRLIEGNLDETLTLWLEEASAIDLVYMDANHRYEPTLRYFDQLLPKLHDLSMVVVDDIHWSQEMNEAWKALCQRPEVSLSLDLFEAGILFLDPKLQKEHYLLSF